jgi:hypothetical protein
MTFFEEEMISMNASGCPCDDQGCQNGCQGCDDNNNG